MPRVSDRGRRLVADLERAVRIGTLPFEEHDEANPALKPRLDLLRYLEELEEAAGKQSD